MTTICVCGHYRSQHNGTDNRCDYDGHTCVCKKYRKTSPPSEAAVLTRLARIFDIRKEKPIIMTGESVRAIIAGKKVQTRRMVFPEPQWRDGAWFWKSPRYDNGDGAHYFHTRHVTGPLLKQWALACPFGKPGHRLWVKETWAPNSPPSGWNYRADDPTDYYKSTGLVKWRSSLFMPRKASRLTLEIIDVRVQQLQDIDRLDVLQEGVVASCNNRRCTCWLDNFRVKWNAINATGQRDYPWLANPWVWAITFRRIL